MWRYTTVWLAATLLTLAGTSRATVNASRHPLNADGCPSRDFPYDIPSFAQYVRSHPLLQRNAHDWAQRPAWFSQQVSDFAFGLGHFAAQYFDKIGDINSVRPNKLEVDCTKQKFSRILNGAQRQHPIQLVWASRFSAETPLLLFRLNTYKDLVDNFFISESMRLAYTGTPKPLVFDMVKHKMLDHLPAITHHVLDDTTWRDKFSWSNATASNTDHVWHNEAVHHKIISKQIVKQYSHLSDDDIVIYGDMDELPDEDLLIHLKHCQLKKKIQLPISSNAVMFQSDYRHLFRSDHSPDPAFPYSLKFPQMWPFGYLRRGNRTKTLRAYKKVSSFPSEPGGYHLTSLLFGPALYMKAWGIAEWGPLKAISNPRFRNVRHYLEGHRNLAYEPRWRRRIPHPDCLVKRYPAYKDFVLKLPWLMAQNLQAFAFAAPCEPAFYDLDHKYKQC